jgi:hypothetical protein
MNLPTAKDHRAAALATLWLVMDMVTDGNCGAIRAWLDRRGNAPGSLLWLAGHLNCRPSILETRIREAALGSTEQRQKLRRRIQKGLKLCDEV